MHFIDTHCHIHFPAYDVDREAVLARLREAGGFEVVLSEMVPSERVRWIEVVGRKR